MKMLFIYEGRKKMTNNSQLRKVADDLEKSLAVYFQEKAPALPVSVRELLVEWLYILVVIGVVMNAWSLLVALGGFLGLGFFSPFYGGLMLFSHRLLLFTLINLFGLLISLVFQVKALPFIKKRSLIGWRWLYWSVLVSVVFELFSFNLLGAIVSGLVGLYFLFQIKEYFK